MVRRGSNRASIPSTVAPGVGCASAIDSQRSEVIA